MKRLLALALVALSAPAGAAPRDGELVEQQAYVFPPWDGVPAWARRVLTPDTYPRMWRDVELARIVYRSDGLRVAGFIYRPRAPKGRLPIVVWNRGGIGEDAKIGARNFATLYEMYRFADAGFVVVASQYRGTDGGEGVDEIGGRDTGDIANLVTLARGLPYADGDRVFMVGFSRGALMTLQLVARGLPLRAAAVVGPPTDFGKLERSNPRLAAELGATDPTYKTDHDGFVRSRSPIAWAEKLDVPLLVLNGGADTATPAPDTMAFAAKLDRAGKLYELHVYARDDHAVSLNREDRLARTIDWFQHPRKLSIAYALDRALREGGAAAAVRRYRELRKQAAERYDFDERELNQLGYELLRGGRAADAIEIFKLNVEAFPASANVYDSLGEAYAAVGDKAHAIASYRRSIELDPKNANAAEQLKKLQ